MFDECAEKNQLGTGEYMKPYCTESTKNVYMQIEIHAGIQMSAITQNNPCTCSGILQAILRTRLGQFGAHGGASSIHTQSASTIYIQYVKISVVATVKPTQDESRNP